ncbi:hypothetical protein Scep_025209 [Stephania cephalantha]|uniref:Late embryogenesis abundant protein LEA-2 subgroup domain-containing protein n=1 Tax=Stephania cephalantha TaxID=152367 RepID=A0AAP0EKD6_9MAGN
MSQHDLEKSPRHCASHHHGGFKLSKFYKRLFYGLSTICISVLTLVFLIWLILRPSKPHFYLKQADLYQLNVTTPHLLNSSMQITLVSKNPNERVGVYYDELGVYASYKGQQITVGTFIPPFYQGHKDTNLLTASLIGSGLPVAPSLGYDVSRDQTAGRLELSLRVDGRLRWKVGTWVSSRYRFTVECITIMGFSQNISSVPLNSIEGAQCSTTV